MFWPYAYGDFFYYALWPDYYDDVDPVWAYGYGDIYSADLLALRLFATTSRARAVTPAQVAPQE